MIYRMKTGKKQLLLSRVLRDCAFPSSVRAAPAILESKLSVTYRT